MLYEVRTIETNEVIGIFKNYETAFAMLKIYNVKCELLVTI